MEPWAAALDDGQLDRAWSLFLERYRSLIIATIRRVIHDRDDVMDAFADVCDALHADELTRLRRFRQSHPHNAQFSTWLVVVVRNLTIDRLRQRDGRRHDVVPANLSELQREIFQSVFIEKRSHREAYELIATRNAPAIGFSRFLREIRDVYRLTKTKLPLAVSRGAAAIPSDGVPPGADARDAIEQADLARCLNTAVASLAPDVRLAVELLVVERVAAADIARVLKWPNAKAVYNRVYRALATVREQLERAGIRREDL
jgi:RNA polymerase sigma factor (sigma-70 family)